MLDKYRKKIDKIDKKLTRLFEERMNVVKEVGEFKKEHNMEIYVLERERIVIEQRIMQIRNIEYKKYAIKFFENIMLLSRKFQEEQKGNKNE